MKKTIVVLLSLVLLTGCFEIDETITLDKNMSGTAEFHLGVDLEPMVVVMAQFAKEMEGKKGPVTEAELAKAREDFKKSSASTKKSSDKLDIKEIEKDLPEGVKLLSHNVTERDFGMATDFKFGFDKLSRLVDVKLPSKEGDPTKKNVVDSPFDGLELIEKDGTFTIRTKPINPQELVQKEAADAPKLDKDTEKLIKDAFSKMRVTYRITAPFPIVSHNATRKQGNTLIWEYDMARFEAMAKSKNLADAGVQVTYKR